MIQASSQLVMDPDTMPNSVHIGIVKFSSTSTIVQEMLKVDTITDRQTLKYQLGNLTAYGATGIGSGIRTAVQVRIVKT